MESIKKIESLNDAIRLCLEALQLVNRRSHPEGHPKTRFDDRRNVLGS